MTRRAALLLLVLAAFATTGSPTRAAEDSAAKSHVVALASERFEGRLAGSQGERLAGTYIASQLERLGAKPLPGSNDYRLPFEFTAGTRDGGSNITVAGAGGT